MTNRTTSRSILTKGSLAAATITGRVISLLLPLSVVALSACWLFMGAGGARDAVMWCAYGVLVTGFAAIVAVRLTLGSPTEGELHAATLSHAGEKPEQSPHRRHRLPGWSAMWKSAAYTTAVLGIAVWGAVGVATPEISDTARKIQESGAAVEEVPVIDVSHIDYGSSRTSGGLDADYTVQVPAGHGTEAHKATFRSHTNQVANKIFIAYSPSDRSAGVIGDDQRTEVERQLAGRTITGHFPLYFAYALFAVALFFCITLVTGEIKRGMATWGAKLSRNAPGIRVTRFSAAGNAAESSSAAAMPGMGRVLAHPESGNPFVLGVTSPSEATAEALKESTGWVLWDAPGNPRESDKKKPVVSAKFVSNDGWEIPGAVRTTTAENLMERVHSSVPDSARDDTVRVDLTGPWPATFSLVNVGWWLLSLLLLLPLLLEVNGGWRAWFAVIGFLAFAAPGFRYISTAVAKMNRTKTSSSGRPAPME